MQQLGYVITRTHQDGRFEITGVSQELREHFSQRAVAIREAMAAQHLTGAKAAEHITLHTREAKRPHDPASLRTEWQARTHAQGYDLQSVVATAHLAREQDHTPVVRNREAAERGLQFAVAHLSERQTMFERHDIYRHALQHTVGEAVLSDVQRAIQRAERNGDLITVSKDRYTTFAALKTERVMVWVVEKGRGSVSPMLMREESQKMLEGRALTRGQKEAAAHVLSTSDRFTGIEGTAGTGKTSMLRIVREEADQKGYHVRGLAPTAAAARVLEEQACIKAQTIASYLGGASPPSKADPKTIYVVDESSMLSTKQAHALVQRIQGEQARAVFLGDRQQLPAIEAGKPWAVLVDRAMTTVQMTEIVRQKDGALKQAVEATLRGDIGGALKSLDEQGKIVEVADRDARLKAIAYTYFEKPSQDRESTLVLTASRADRDALNSAIREGLKREGVLSGSGLQTEVLISRNVTKAMAAQAGNHQVEDIVRFGAAYRHLGVIKGEYGTVTAISQDTNAVRLRLERDGREVTWKPDQASKVETYRSDSRELQVGETIRWTRNDVATGRRNGETATVVDMDPQKMVATVDYRGVRQTMNLSQDRHWEYGYAQTVHASQGRTASSVVYHIDTTESALTGREAWYVGISRARTDVQIFVDDRTAVLGAVSQTRQQQSALEEVERGRDKSEPKGRAQELER